MKAPLSEPIPAPKPTRLSRTPWLVAVIGVALSVTVFLVAWRAERRHFETETQRQVALFLGSLNEQRIGIEDVLRTLRALFCQVTDLSRSQFRDALSDLAVRTRGVQGFVWAPRVTQAGREAFQARVRQDGFPDFQILEGDLVHPESDRPTRAADRAVYLPVEFIEPYESNRRVFGFDLLSVPELQAINERARDENSVVLSSPFRMPFEDQIVRGFLVAIPVYRPSLRPASVQDRRAEFQGSVLALIVFRNLMDSIAARVPELQLDFMVTDVGQSGSERGMERVLYSGSTGAKSRKVTETSLEEMRRTAQIQRPLVLSGLRWIFHFRRSGGWNHGQQFSSPVALLIGGLLVTAAATRHLASMRRQAVLVEGLVHERTAELATANRRLEGEVAERTQAETALAYERNLLRTLLDRLPDAVFVADRTCVYGMLNDRHRDLLRLQRLEDALNRPVREVGPPPLAQALALALADGFDRIGTRGLPDLHRELQVQMDPESSPGLFLEISHLPLRQADGTVDRLVVLIRDVTAARLAETERQEFNLRLQETQKLESLGLIAGSIAHDFNNLLGAVVGNTGVARLKLPPDSPAAPHLDEIDHISTRASDLCRQMLAYAGKGRFVVRRIDLNELVTETTDLIRISISKKAQVKLNLGTALPAIEGDATQLRQILMNLTLNASDALDDRVGFIRVSTELIQVDRKSLAETILGAQMTEGPHLCLEISDDGCGMNAETIQKIFDPFFTTKFFGRGLGLAAVLGIIRSHRGGIRVTSEPGRGTVFRVLLPCTYGSTDETPTPPSVEPKRVEERS